MRQGYWAMCKGRKEWQVAQDMGQNKADAGANQNGGDGEGCCMLKDWYLVS